jgi:hypothetical protein
VIVSMMNRTLIEILGQLDTLKVYVAFLM